LPNDLQQLMASQDPIREQSLERSLPNSAEAERAILGGIILDNGLISQAIELLRPEDFYVPSHRRIFVAMTALFERGAEINPILIGEELKKENALESVGVSFITNLTYGLPHSTNIAHYAKVVRGKSMLRQLIRAANKITQEALEQEDEPEIILDHAEHAIFQLADERIRQGFVHVEPIAQKLLEKIQEMEGRASVLTGLTTGFADLDKLTSGLQRQDLIIVAARPSMGKTSLALMLAENAAIHVPGAVVGMFSLEMSKEALVMRMLCSQGNIDAQRFRNGFLSRPEWAQIAKSLGTLAEAKIFLDDTAGITVLEMRAKARRLAAEQKRLDLIVVDYLQLMSGSAKRFESRQQEVSLISRELKGLAKELNVPLVALSQLSRAPESRSDHRPQLADLRESGALEQDADVVAFIYRPEQYKTPEERDNMPDDEKNVAELIVAKQRNGPTDTIRLRFTPSSMRFDNLYRE
jgi:replicative DNA helicase